MIMKIRMVINMSKIVPTDTFKQKLFDKYGNDYTVIGEYVKSNEKVEIMHKCGYSYFVTPSNILSGKQCPKCQKRVRYTIGDAKEIFKKSQKTLLTDEFKGVLSSMPFVCDLHKEYGVQHATLSSVIHGGGCRLCKNEKIRNSQPRLKYDQKSVTELFKKSHLIVCGAYESMTKPINFYCEKHEDIGMQTMTLNNFLYQHSTCKYCARENISKEKSTPIKEIEQILGSMDLEYVDSKVDKSTIVKFICKKHKDYGVQTSRLYKLKQGQGCKLCSASSGETMVSSILHENNIGYEFQKKFDGLVGEKNGQLSYDFFIPKYNALIEYQGQQHYMIVDAFNATDETLRKQKKHDELKREYAKNNGITLIEIPYWLNRNKVEDLLLCSLKTEVA